MGIDNVTRQMKNANTFFDKIQKNYANSYNIAIAGHSEGGSEAIYVGLLNNTKVYTYNAFPLGNDILNKIAESGGSTDYNNLIVNYRDAHDPISKLFNQHIGQTYIVESQQNKFMAKTPFGLKAAHSLVNMGSCQGAIPLEQYKKENPWFIDTIKLVKFTNKTIDSISKAGLYDIYEPEIMERLKVNEIISDSNANQMVEEGQLTYISGYQKQGGSITDGYYEQLT